MRVKIIKNRRKVDIELLKKVCVTHEKRNQIACNNEEEYVF